MDLHETWYEHQAILSYTTFLLLKFSIISNTDAAVMQASELV
jgi:hypothetical protein